MKPDDIPQDVWDEMQALQAAREAKRPEDMPADIWREALSAMNKIVDSHLAIDGDGCEIDIGGVEVIARAIHAERERWTPAAIYFERYCQDEADDAENCVCGEKQHEDAKAFASVIIDDAEAA